MPLYVASVLAPVFGPYEVSAFERHGEKSGSLDHHCGGPDVRV